MKPSSEVQNWLRRTRVVGFCLFALSFLAPSRIDDLHLFGGIGAFIGTPMNAGDFLAEGDVSHVLFGICALASWAANFTIFSRKKAVEILGVLCAWIGYVAFFEILAGFIPFYPWAIGITIINMSRLFAPGAASETAPGNGALISPFQSGHPSRAVPKR